MEQWEDDFSELNEVPRDNRKEVGLPGPEEGAPRTLTQRRTEVYQRDRAVELEPDIERRQTMEVRTIDVGALEEQLKKLGTENRQMKQDLSAIAQRLHVNPRDREMLLHLLDNLIDRGAMGSLVSSLPSPIRSVVERASCKGYSQEELIKRWICEGAERLHSSGVLGP